MPALGLFFEHLLQNVPIQGQIGHQALQACILVSQLPELTQLAHSQVAVLLLPDIERGFADDADVYDGLNAGDSGNSALVPCESRVMIVAGGVTRGWYFLSCYYDATN